MGTTRTIIRISILLGLIITTFSVQSIMAQEKITQTAGHVQLGEFAPKFARQNGVTRTEISEMLTHIAFYAGWPNAWGAFRLAKDVWAEDTEADGGKAAFQREMIFPIGEPNTAYAEYFIGNSYLAPISTEQVSFSNVTFEPGCRNNWHIHRASKGGGQMLVCVAGRGWYQEEGKPAVEMLPGDVIHIPANVKHWHGAAADSWFAHLAFEIPGENTSNEWLEPVTDEEYAEVNKK